MIRILALCLLMTGCSGYQPSLCALVTGCTTAKEWTEAKDQALRDAAHETCTIEYGLKRGTDGYAQCRLDLLEDIKEAGEPQTVP
jgi:hypothetical protein